MSSSVGQVSFGGADVRNGQFLRVHGTTTSVTNDLADQAGNTFFVGENPIRIVAMSCDRSRETPASIVLMGNNAVWGSWDFRGNAVVFNQNFIVPRRTRVQLKSHVGGQWLAPGNCLITLYVRWIVDQVYRHLTPSTHNDVVARLVTIPFGGQNMGNLSYFRFNGNADSPVNATQNGAGNVFVVGAPMILTLAFWHKTNLDLTNVQVLKNNIVVADLSMSAGRTGSTPPLNLQVAPLDRLQVKCAGGSSPGTSLLTFYAQPASMHSPISAGIIYFGGDVKVAGNFLRANGNATSVVNSVEHGVGNVSLVGVMSQPYAVTWNTAYGRFTTTLQLLKNNTPIYELDFLEEGSSGARNIWSEIFAPGETMQLRYVGGHPPEGSVVSIYMAAV